MTAHPVTFEDLLEIRARLLARLPGLLDRDSCAYLVSVEREMPDFDLIELPQAANLPGVRRKLQNMARRSAAKREADYRQLMATLERITALR